MLFKSYFLYKLFLEIAENLELECFKEYSFKLTKNSFNNKRLLYALINHKKENTIYNNINYIKKILSIDKLPNFSEGYISEFTYACDLEKCIYKIYVSILDLETGLETNYADEYIEEVCYPRIYYQKKIKANMIRKYSFLKKYKKYINFRNFDYYYERVKNKKVETIHLIYNINTRVYDFKKLFIKICDNLEWDKKKVIDFFDKMKNKKYNVNIIGLSSDNINLYFYKKIW